MTLYCPVCGAALDAGAARCANGHSIGRGAGGVIRLMTPAFAARVDAFEDALAAFRASVGVPRLDPGDYADLPARPASRRLAAWVGRAQDLDLIRRHAPPGAALRVLDLGAWNGWLSDALARDGHAVTAVSFFGGSEDGLGARSRYPSAAWTAIQMDEGRLDLIGETFDRVVVNRCLHAAPDPSDRLRAAIGLLRPGGIVIATGLPVYGDPRRRAADFAAEAAAFEARSGMPYRLVPGRDWLGPPEVDALVRLGAEFRPYPGQALRRLKARLRPASPTLQYLVAHA